MLDAVEVHPLLCAVAHLTGDFSLLRADLAPDQAQMLVPGRGLGPEQEAEAPAPSGGQYGHCTRLHQSHLECTTRPGSGVPIRHHSGLRLPGADVCLSTQQWSRLLVEERRQQGTDRWPGPREAAYSRRLRPRLSHGFGHRRRHSRRLWQAAVL